MKNSAVTIKDIARKLGVSTSTVSRALGGHHDVGAKTREAVQELAEQLNYRPNSIAISLKRQQTKTIGVLIPEMANAFFSKAVSGIQEVSARLGFNIIICQSNESVTSEIININTLMNSMVDGIIVSVSRDTKNPEHYSRLVDQGFPIVFFDRIIESLKTSIAITDNFEASYKATSHLIAQGCTRIAKVAGPMNLYISKKRLGGYKMALSDHGLAFDQSLIVDSHYHSKRVLAYLEELLDLSNPPDGILAINDNHGVEILYHLRKKGIKVPEDIAVVGFNNDRFSPFVSPSLTSVESPAYEIGKAAAELIIDKLTNKASSMQKRIIESRLIIRESSLRKKSADMG